MSLISADAVILQTFAYSETSKVLRLFTRSHGVVSVIARGALRPKSRYGGVLEPFTEGVASVYMKDGRELQNLSGFDLLRSRQSLGTDLVRFGGASLLAELLLRTGIEGSDPALYDGFRAALDRVEHTGIAQLEGALLAEVWSLIGLLGFAPSLDACVHCGRSIETAEASIFEYESGGVRCLDCLGTGPGRDLPADARFALKRFCDGDALTLDRTAAHWALLGRFLSHHVIEGSQLRSLAFLAEALERQACAS